VSHSGLGKAFAQTRKPVIHMLHGRPYSTFLLEQMGKIAVLSYLQRIRQDRRFRGFVTFWPEFLDYWSLFVPEKKLFVIKPPVDLGIWTPDGPNGYQFHGELGRVNVVCADVWRHDIDPFHVIMAYRLYAEDNPGAKLHVYAAPDASPEPATSSGWNLVRRLMGDSLGEVCGFVKGLDNVYRAADVMITPHRIATRSVREALACGCSVVMAPGNTYTDYVAEPEDLRYYATMISMAVQCGDKNTNRAAAQRCFSSERTAVEFLEMVDRVI
jgi:glycosyltransferase involved in cell wall biosynthesis